jgi:hypothetical protein
MKTRIALLLLASAVLLSAHVGALPANSTSAGTAAPFCFTQSASPTLPDWASNGMVPVITLPHCGVCSTNCSGAKLGAQCGIGPGGRIEWCQNQGTTCSQDGLPNCLCTYLPIQ